MKTKKLTMLLACATLFASAAAQAQTLLLDYNFNDGTASDSSGNDRDGALAGSGVIAADGSGVSGLAGDRAFDNAPSSGGAVNYVSAHGLNGLTSFTYSFWYNTSTARGIGNRLFESNANGSALLQFASSNTLQLGINGASTSPLTTPETPVLGLLNTWVYVAVTFDAALEGKELKLYAGSYDGTTLNTAMLIIEADYAGASISLTANNGTFTIGNRSNLDREFTGLLDNIKIYGAASGNSGALGIDQIRALQATAIPEPSVIALMLGAISLGLVTLWHKR